MSRKRAVVVLVLCGMLGCSSGDQRQGAARTSGGANGSGQDVGVVESGGASIDTSARGTVSPTPNFTGVIGGAGYPLPDFASLHRGREIPIASSHS